ncbi:hypothetical protein RF11_06681 [Thelohanellus kitauei]|uniref:Protein O-linked-mannose beta-1,2-N-acetylglucosaminyltransferase 1 n=1 Tax=Thelohanellus kitauei TaxID=669202 RepID=A0A0C2MJR3_THEKT|nr:hypothetical protein RF11_06681 [Thelohanellus kitauei]
MERPRIYEIKTGIQALGGRSNYALSCSIHARSRSSFIKRHIKEILKKWPHWTDFNWDVWIRESVLKDRVCIIPDVSRTFHIGGYGVHINPDFQQSHFERHFFRPEINVTISVENLENAEYSDLILYLAINSKKQIYDNLCKIAETAKSVDLHFRPLSRTELSAITRVVVMNADLKSNETFLTLFK